jgi:hypothetical protein
MTMSLAPFFFAASTKGQKWTLDETMLAPHAMMSFAFSTFSGSNPMVAPMTALYPSKPAEAQMVRSSSEAPSEAKRRRSRLP